MVLSQANTQFLEILQGSHIVNPNKGDSYQTAHMPFLICVFVVRITCVRTYTHGRVKLGKTPMRGQTSMPFIYKRIMMIFVKNTKFSICRVKFFYAWSFCSIPSNLKLAVIIFTLQTSKQIRHYVRGRKC